MKYLKITILAALTAAAVFACTSTSRERDYQDPVQLEKLIEEQLEPYFLVDVRTAGEYADGFIPTAVNIPHTEIAGSLPTEDREALVIVYCRSGNRSGQAARTLKELGFERIVDFGGISNWRGDLEKP